MLRKKLSKTVTPLSLQELEQAEKTIYRVAQKDFQKEVTNLIDGKPLDKKSHIYKLSPYVESDGVLRIRGRTDESNSIGFETKRPIILPKNNKITFLIVAFYHRKYHHQNHETVINELRQKYWVINVRAVLKRVKAECNQCKITLSVPIVPEMSNLPQARMAAFTRPFTYVNWLIYSDP